jgi:geranylgeranyl pyrophosphate synthase
MLTLPLPMIELPRPVAPERERPPQANIPPSRAERERIKSLAARYVETVKPTPPLSMEELRKHSERLLAGAGLSAAWREFTAVILNGEVWRESLAAVPFDRRLLLMPKCLRVEEHCPAPFDEFGLLCKQCGMCSIQDLQAEAERLGYAVLVAEGSALVMAMIQTGKIDAIVGVSCLSVLEKAFPYMESAAIPGVAIPLLQDDCKDTTVDTDWIWDVIHLTADDKTRRLDLDALRREVDGWFAPAELDRLMGPAATEAERLGREWLAKTGKRWRPFLAACAYRALKGDETAASDGLPDGLRRLAIAVECFHKASLVHDDIEDGDATRYGEPTLHETHGVAVALNVGDLLLGDGYRMIAECDAPPAAKAAMLRIASAGHRTLCLGQGAELSWTRRPGPLASLSVLDIFRGKTAPAFEVALRLGAAYAGEEDAVGAVLSRYSEALGIAYQIRDDLSDLEAGRNGGDRPDDIDARRPNLPAALALERAKGDDRPLLEAWWARRPEAEAPSARVREAIRRTGALERSRALLDSYKEEAVRSLVELEHGHAGLKGLLRRVISKIFTVEVKGWCSEFEARNAAGREAGPQAAG